MKSNEKTGVEKLLKKKAVAELLDCSPRSVERLAASGELSRVKVLGAVRFRLSQVEAIMQGGGA